MKLREIKTVLAQNGIRLTKSLGQNFLHDGNQLSRIIDLAKIAPGDSVLEIGPGLGALTARLLSRDTRVIAIEKDRRLVEFLQERFPDEARLLLIHDDALRYLRRERDWADWTLVSNLPYAVASALLVEIARNHARPKRMVVTLQLEVANRIQANPRSRDYGILTLLLKLRYDVAGGFRIPRACFFPEPDVDSACLALVRRQEPLLPTALEADFETLVKISFSQRRKMMKKLLKAGWRVEELEAAWQNLGLPHDLRAEHLSLDGFVRLTQVLYQSEI